MSGLGGVMKGGWHPKGKDGQSRESWRGDFKGINQVAGWVGKGKDSNSTETARDHVSQPISSLKDPSSFGPPPKHVAYGGTAVPNPTTPDRRGMGQPLTEAQINAHMEEQDEKARREEEKAAAPPVPYRADTTGLSTAHLPPPPMRKDGVAGRVPLSMSKPKPSLPPRLPARQQSNPSSGVIPLQPIEAPATEPPSHKGILNQGSLNRLGASGISVSSLGIGGKQTLPPPQLSPKPASPAPSNPASRNDSQLSELQSRFSRLGKSSPASEASSQGTTFAQKQAALRTASSFRNDPSSVSISDARAAASTANNFRERHGDQVASGWQSANKLNQKYGIAENFGSYASPAAANSSPKVPASSPSIDMRDNTASFKKAPPPPPKKRLGLASDADAGIGLPPPIPLASKPKPNNISSPEQKDLDLDLKSLWFAQTPPAFPPYSIARLPGSRSYSSSSGWSSSGVRKTHTFTGAIRDNNTLGTTMIHLTWDGSNPALTVKAQQKHIAPPRMLSAKELETYRDQYSEQLARWCEGKMGTQVGDGECWTLAAEGLSAVADSCRARNMEECMTSQGVVHGCQIFGFLSPQPCSPPDGIEAAGVTRGDIIQFLSCHFKSKDGMGESWAGAPDHTAVVVGVEKGGLLRVVEQNVGGVKRVKDGKYDFSELVSGGVRIFRAVGEGWVGRLEASWS